jgi:hypothetical protein
LQLCALSISLAGGTPGWLWNLRPGGFMLTCSQTERAWQPAQRKTPTARTQTPGPARGPPLPDATKSIQSHQNQAPGARSETPKPTRRRRLRNPHSVTRQQPNQPPAWNPPLPAATKSLQSRGDRDRTPTQMAVISVETRHQSRASRHSQTRHKETS